MQDVLIALCSHCIVLSLLPANGLGAGGFLVYPGVRRGRGGAVYPGVSEGGTFSRVTGTGERVGGVRVGGSCDTGGSRVVGVRSGGVCQLVGLSACWEVGELAGWTGGRQGAGARSQHSRKKGGVGTPASIFPREGEKKKGGVPTHSHRTGRREERGISHSKERAFPEPTPPHRAG